MSAIKDKLLICLLFFSFSYLGAQSGDSKKLEEFLSQQKDIIFKKVEQQADGLSKYELKIKQPLDWDNPEKGFFYQKVLLTHSGFTNPIVMETQGYQIYKDTNELQKILNSNNLNIEHRYFGESVPDSTQFNWKYLNLYNATHDLHHINQIFKNIYKEKWISTGISKGGQTTIYYRYFFPEDVDVSIPYVAPINYSLEDPRIYTFFEEVGTPECRKKIEDFQVYMLQNKEEALKYLKKYSEVRGITYDYLGSLGKAYEYTVLEYPFSFWQWGLSCNNIPKNPEITTALDYLLNIVDISFFGDKEIKNLAPHYYQAALEMGYYGYNIAPLKKYLTYFKENPSAIFAPKEAGDIIYSKELNDKLKKWLDTKANNIIYIYGGIDTWSATKVIPSLQTNSIILELPKASHATARIKNMDNAMKGKLSKTLYEWINIKPNYNKL